MLRRWCALTVAMILTPLVLISGAAIAQPTPDDDLVHWGEIATIAPLCGLRAERWAFDLRRAELQSATGSPGFDDQSLATAPGSNEAAAALSYAETEAMEHFAETTPKQSCAGLAGSDELTQADEIVRAFRVQRDQRPGS